MPRNARNPEARATRARDARKPRRAMALLAAAGLALPLLVSPAGPAAAGTCAPTPGLLSRAPAASYALPGGGSVRIWDTGRLSNRVLERRLAVVRIPRGSLTPSVATAPTISRAAKPSSMVAGDANAVVVINGGTFNAAVPGIPDRVQIAGGVVRKLVRQEWSRGFFGGIAVDSAARTVTGAGFDLAGDLRTPAGTVPVGAVNWQFLSSGGVSVYTYAWGSHARHPAGPRTVAIAGEKVARILIGTAGTTRPAAGESWVTAPSGTSAAALLSRLRVGDAVSLSYSAHGTTRHAGWPATSFSRPTGATGSGGAIVKAGAVAAPCTTRDEQLRPRSAIAWDADGNMLVVAIAGRATVNGTRWGGASVHQFADLLRRLGAVTAIRLDGGTSTTLWVRKSVGGRLVRLDRSSLDYEREVVDALVFRAL